MCYFIKYFRPDYSFGAYRGTSKEAFETELRMCLENGYEFITSVTKKED